MTYGMILDQQNTGPMRTPLCIVSMENAMYLDLLSVIVGDILHNRADTICVYGLLSLFSFGLL